MVTFVTNGGGEVNEFVTPNFCLMQIKVLHLFSKRARMAAHRLAISLGFFALPRYNTTVACLDVELTGRVFFCSDN